MYPTIVDLRSKNVRFERRWPKRLGSLRTAPTLRSHCIGYDTILPTEKQRVTAIENLTKGNEKAMATTRRKSRADEPTTTGTQTTTKKATAEKSSSKKSTANKPTAKKSAAKKTTAKKSTAKKSTPKSSAKRTTAKKTAAKKTRPRTTA